MDLNAIQMQNFMSVKSASLSLSGQGLTLIDGENLDNPALDNNGAGKSTLIEGVVYALFGRTLRGARGDAVVNSVTKKDCSVALMLTDDNGDKYVIVRNRKHRQRKNSSTLLFTPNGAASATDITPKSEKDFDAEIERIIGMDYTTFVSSVVYSDSSFRFTSATDAELKQVFEKMLGIGVWTLALAETKRRIVSENNERAKAVNEYSIAVSAERSYEEVLKRHIQNSQAFQEQEAKRMRSLADSLSHHRDSVAAAKKTLGEKRNAWKLLNDDMEVKRAFMEQVKEKMASYDQESDNWARDNRQYQEDVSALSNLRRKCDSASDAARSDETKMAQINADLVKLGAELSEAQTSAIVCPYCKQPLTPEHKERVISEIRERISGKEAELKAATESHDKWVKTEDALISQVESRESELDAVRDELSARKASLDQSSVKTAHTKAQNDFTEAYQRVVDAKGEVDAAQRSLEYAQSKADDAQRELDAGEKPNPYAGAIEDARRMISQSKLDANERSKRIKEHDAVLASLQFWESAFGNSGIKSFLLDSVTPFLTERANFYLSKLAGSRIQAEFETQTQLKTGEFREKFAINVRNLDGGSSYALNSGGEKKRVDLAIYFALQDLVASRANKKFNVVFCDEAFDALDESGMESVAALLKEIAKEKSSVFVVTHSGALKSEFSNVVTVRKENGLSSIAYGD